MIINDTRDNIMVSYRTKYISEGDYGKIFLLSNNNCVKFFKYNTENDDKLINTIKNLKLNNFYEIKELLYDKDKSFIGYLMKYYNSYDLDIMLLESNYTLSNLFSLSNSVIELSNDNINVCDLVKKNTLYTDEGITIIDIDNYVFNKLYSDKNDLTIDNLMSLRNLFISLFKSSRKKYHDDLDIQELDIRLKYLFDLDNGFENARKVLRKYKYPIDSFQK